MITEINGQSCNSSTWTYGEEAMPGFATASFSGRTRITYVASHPVQAESRLYGSHAAGNGRSTRSGEGGRWTAIINVDVVVIVDLSVRSEPEIDWRLPDYKKLRCESENLSRISPSIHALPAELRLSS